MAIEIRTVTQEKEPEWQTSDRFPCPSLLECESGLLWLRCSGGGVVRIASGVYMHDPHGNFRLYKGTIEMKNKN